MMDAKIIEKEMALAIANSAVGECPEIRKRANLKVTNIDHDTCLDDTTAACVKSFPHKRNLKGTGLRLSWPNVGDSRRAVVGKLPSHASQYGASHNNNGPYSSDARITHVSYADIEMHYSITNQVAKESTQPVLHIPLVWNPIKLEVGDTSLFDYFRYSASQSLAVFGHDPIDLGNALIRISLASETTSAVAALQSLLALSSLHRHDVHSQAVELKISALKSLSAAAGSHFGTTEAAQHVAAGMLLCSFEVHQSSCTSGQWLWYLSGVKNLIKATGLDKHTHDSDIAMLLDWVYYYDVLARFTLRHWDRETVENTSAESSIRAEASQAAPSALTMVEMLSEVCDAVSTRPPARSSLEDIDDYKNFLKILDWRIRAIQVKRMANDTTDAPLVMELYQLATLVYLNRASDNVLNQTSRIQQHIDRAFTLFSQLEYCVRQFPIFVLGCEARRDDQRAAVLDLISRSEKHESSRSFNHVKLLIQAIWAQDDLANGEINYWDKVSYIISRCSILPTFV
ncbi:fungal-specific transcription factor domain-containing protein [Daldinia caldariorum]|uniref:fungal-specific transcription factor domain-containing protein n=1 Tax=Daldinia caldariorum TaxID=326644 RepID=UPI0020088DB1|nr:fungal-specific transcription factor domain-containing protein [Daldinia caldariorum]KAI1470390.1 fungal-specific transcription factor domain-containing protein [Daldinia caldariorum]